VAAVAAGLGAPYVLGIIGNLHVLWLPLFENPDQPYAVFSFVHLWEWMNAQILGSPVAWPLLVFCGLVMRQSRRWADPYSVFLLLSAGGLVYGSLTLDFVLGSRDWDLQCFGSIALILLATDGIVRLLRSDLSSSLRHYVLGCAVVFSALNTIPWVHVNHTDRSVDRLSRMLSDDPATYYRKHPSDLMLGVLYNQAGLTRQALAAFERGMKRYPLDARLAYNAAALYLDLDQVDRAIVCGSRAVELEPGYVKVHALLALAYHTIRRLEKSLYHAERYLSLGGKDRVLQNLARDILKQEGLSGSASSSDR
jgi:tetratricopeptide (TPR) repeat protein